MDIQVLRQRIPNPLRLYPSFLPLVSWGFQNFKSVLKSIEMFRATCNEELAPVSKEIRQPNFWFRNTYGETWIEEGLKNLQKRTCWRNHGHHHLLPCLCVCVCVTVCGCVRVGVHVCCVYIHMQLKWNTWLFMSSLCFYIFSTVLSLQSFRWQ